MGTATRPTLQVNEHTRKQISSNGGRHLSERTNGNGFHGIPALQRQLRPRVFVATENRLLREALSRMLTKAGDIEVITEETAEPVQDLAQKPLQSFSQEEALRLPAGPLAPLTIPFLVARDEAEIVLLSSKGNLDQDLAAIRKIRSAAPEALILLIDVSGDEATFLQCIRAGVRGYLPSEASAKDVVEAVRAIHAGKAVCPGTLCAALFRYLEREATCFPSASVHQRLGLTRREQQLIPLVAEGLTNQEIANHFCLSEQTVKNHLYRMKQKIGADDRLSIVQVCRTQGFMV
ncbi:MAG TPA: response regulator transcription factor [Candidatus Acidoferrum sp.]